MIMPPPTPRDLYAQGLFRLAGFGGALVILRSGVDEQGLTLDVGLLSPSDYVWFLRRPVAAGFTDRLAELFFDSANQLRPEDVVGAVRDEASGLEVQVLSSSDSRVELQFQMVGPDVGEEVDGLNFETSRVALVQAATEVRALEKVEWRNW